MRLIGHLKSESSAKVLADYLVSVDIKNQVEPDAEGWGVWIFSEDQIEAGKEALTSYLQNPTDGKYQDASRQAAAVDERHRLDKAEFEKRVRTADQIWISSSVGPVTLSLIVVSVCVTLMVFGNVPAVNALKISQSSFGVLPEVRSGEVWRLITPIFIHFTVMHIVFNMLMLRDLGSLIEIRQSWKVLLALVVVIGVGSNLGQYFHGGPEFGGFSGVLYGLMGYAWIRSQVDPDSRLYISSTTVTVMLVWFFLCLFEVIPNAANACHAYGLVMGMVIGAAPLLLRKF